MKTHSRIKVAVRCRPPFKDEIEDEPLLDMDTHVNSVTLKVHPNKFREFGFDYVFGTSATQDEVFEAVAEPIVREVLYGGYNGTIMAYGQTGSHYVCLKSVSLLLLPSVLIQILVSDVMFIVGTGKTHTMGVLEFVEDEHAGIIPRSVSRIFEYSNEMSIDEASNINVVVSLSFLQLYKETIQDLLAPVSQMTSPTKSFVSASNTNMSASFDTSRSKKKNQNHSSIQGSIYGESEGGSTGEEFGGLSIREDPITGFYVEGLREYQVNSYGEAGESPQYHIISCCRGFSLHLVSVVYSHITSSHPLCSAIYRLPSVFRHLFCFFRCPHRGAYQRGSREPRTGVYTDEHHQ
jgi:Kinesin motor domain